jgi:hypothetical protein
MFLDKEHITEDEAVCLACRILEMKAKNDCKKEAGNNESYELSLSSDNEDIVFIIKYK